MSWGRGRREGEGEGEGEGEVVKFDTQKHRCIIDAIALHSSYVVSMEAEGIC